MYSSLSNVDWWHDVQEPNDEEGRRRSNAGYKDETGRLKCVPDVMLCEDAMRFCSSIESLSHMCSSQAWEGLPQTTRHFENILTDNMGKSN